MMAPPGMHLDPLSSITALPGPPGIAEPLQLQQEHRQLLNERMELEGARMAQEAAMRRLVNEQLELEGLRVAQENAMLRAQLHSSVARENALLRAQLAAQLAASACVDGPPGCFAKVSMSSRSTSASSSCSDDDSAAQTTALVRNLPCEYSRDDLIDLLDREGFHKLYDLVYLPTDFASSTGFGYGFVNFTSAEALRRFRDHFDRFTDWGIDSDKVCDPSGLANKQGFAANVEAFRNSPVMHESIPEKLRPAVFQDGVRKAMPAPTKRVRAPAVRQRHAARSAANEI